MGDHHIFPRFFKRRIKDLVLGANDGIITTFAIIAGVTRASLEAGVVIVLGVANLLADGLSMGSSNYLGRKSEKHRDGNSNLKGFRMSHCDLRRFRRGWVNSAPGLCCSRTGRLAIPHGDPTHDDGALCFRRDA